MCNTANLFFKYKMNANELVADWPEHLEECEKLPAIANIGNTWLANAELQVLNHTPVFLNHFINYSCQKEKCLRKQLNGEIKQGDETT